MHTPKNYNQQTKTATRDAIFDSKSEGGCFYVLRGRKSKLSNFPRMDGFILR